MGWLVLRSAAEKRPPQHPDQRTWVKSGVQRRTFSSESQFGLEIRQGFGKMAASEAANGKSRLESTSDRCQIGPGAPYLLFVRSYNSQDRMAAKFILDFVGAAPRKTCLQ